MSGVTRAAISSAIPADACVGGPRRLRTAFVLSGGASLGALQVGMLRALYERGIVPDLLVGASAGALNAAFVASRPQSVETVDELATVWRNLRREDVFPFRWRAWVRGLAGSHDHLVGDGGLPLLNARPGARVVTMSSDVAAAGRIDFDDLQARRRYGLVRTYAQS
jgi:predicted acylesterase/phospholipase RssA